MKHNEKIRKNMLEELRIDHLNISFAEIARMSGIMSRQLVWHHMTSRSKAKGPGIKTRQVIKQAAKTMYRSRSAA